MNILENPQLWYILRMLVAGMCGVMIGFERKNRSKEAGVRTHCVVACAAALMMLVSKYGFSDLQAGAQGAKSADGARIAAQVVSGIGFLGAGMIFVHKNTVTGLTTAAGIWATAGVGLAIGSGMYTVGISASLIIVLAQILLHRNVRWLKTPRLKKLTVRDVTAQEFQDDMTFRLNQAGASVYDVYIEKNDDSSNYTFIIEIPPEIQEEKIINTTGFSFKLSANV